MSLLLADSSSPRPGRLHSSGRGGPGVSRASEPPPSRSASRGLVRGATERTAALAGFPCCRRRGLRATGEEAWLAGGLVLFEGARRSQCSWRRRPPTSCSTRGRRRVADLAGAARAQVILVGGETRASSSTTVSASSGGAGSRSVERVGVSRRTSAAWSSLRSTPPPGAIAWWSSKATTARRAFRGVELEPFTYSHRLGRATL